MYQVYATFSSYGRGWFKVNKALFKTKQEAENFIKKRQNVVLYATMKYKIKNTDTNKEYNVKIKKKSFKPSKKLPKGYIKYKSSMKLKFGDKIIADMGDGELFQGVVHNPDDTLDGKKHVSFWSCDSGWKCLEYTTKRQIKGIKK